MIDFNEIYADHHAALLRTTTRRCGSDLQTAADICAEAWARAWKRRATYDPAHGSVGAWLYRICQSVMIDHFRRQRVTLPLMVDPPDDEPDDDPPDVAMALDALPAPWAEAVRVVYLEGRTQREAAQALGCPRSTLQERTQKGLHRLRKILAA